MNRVCRWLIEWLSRSLEPDERQAVLGDFLEAAASPGRALLDMAGLVARRQAALWTGWSPWLTLVFFLIPLSILLSIVSMGTSGRSEIYLWIYLYWGKQSLLKIPDFRNDAGHYFVAFLVGYLSLACWSWTSGFLLGLVSRSKNKVNGVLFFMMLFVGAILIAPAYSSYYQHYVMQVPWANLQTPRTENAPVLARVLFPSVELIVLAVFVALPSFWGMRQGAHVQERPHLLQTALRSGAILSITGLVFQVPGFLPFIEGFNRPQPWILGFVQILQILVFWPALYLVANAIARRRKRIPSSL